MRESVVVNFTEKCLQLQVIPALYLDVIDELASISSARYTVTWQDFSDLAIKASLHVEAKKQQVDVQNTKVLQQKESSSKIERRRGGRSIVDRDDDRFTYSSNPVRLSTTSYKLPQNDSAVDEVKTVEVINNIISHSQYGEDVDHYTPKVNILSESEIQTCSRVLHIWGFLVRFEDSKVMKIKKLSYMRRTISIT